MSYTYISPQHRSDSCGQDCGDNCEHTRMTDFDPILATAINRRNAAAKRKLTAAGLNQDQWNSVTGLGGRHVEGCMADDTILNKVVAGALTAEGAARILGLIR